MAQVLEIYMKIILLAALCCLGSLTMAEDKPDTQKVFRLITRKGDREYTATAFFISPNRLLTAAHTFRHGTKDFFIDRGGREVYCKVLRVDFDKDIALLECAEACESHYRLVSTIKVVGFPGNNTVAEEAPGHIDLKHIHAHVHFVPGMSGGPLVNEYGDVEGMGVENNSDYDCKAVPASVLAEFVKTVK